MNIVDKLLNNITMYRLMLYYLIVLVLFAFGLSFFGLLPFDPLALSLSTAFIIAISWLTNTIFARLYHAPTNLESVYITSLILILIITPARNFHDLPLLFWASVLAMASKYILAINKKHLFNPVAIALFLTSLSLDQSASWWVGTLNMLPLVFLGGILIVRKLSHFDLVFSFLIFAVVGILGLDVLKGIVALDTLQKIFLYSPILFFAFVMLTEPLTTPPTKNLRLIYGAIVGILFSPQIHFVSFYSTPEISLLIGNIFAYMVSPKQKLLIKLKDKIQLSTDIFEFVFTPNKKMAFNAGQYMEWTLGYPHPDSRGNRRYFTLASSPTENNLRIGVKFYPQSSSYKKALRNSVGSIMVASGLAGEFTLPKDENKKLVFLAGGIGVTPFRSMVKYLLDTNQSRDVVLFYSNNTKEEIVYQDIFAEAQRRFGLKVVYTLTDLNHIPPGWNGETGYINEQIIKTEVADFKERFFYLSGPHSMVNAFEKVLKGIGVPSSQIKTDFFPGYA